MPQSPFSIQKLRLRAEAELNGDILPFWAKHAFDPATGRMAGVVTNDLRKFDDVPRHVVLCARILWTYAAAARLDPKPLWLETGRKALAQLTGPFWDTSNGGVFWSIDADGKPMSDRKQVYAEAFTIYGLAEWYLATGDQMALAKAKEIFEALEKHARESEHGGYIEALSVSWSQLEDMRLSDKDLNSPKSMNTLLHVLEAYTTLLQAWPDARVRKSLRDLLIVMLDHVVTTVPYTRCALFFTMDWRSLNNKISYGHDIEASWLLWEAAAALGEPELMQRTKRIALEMADGVLANGIDSDGAVFYDGDAKGVLSSEKHWWPQAEAVVGFLNAHTLSGEAYHLSAATRAWEFIENKVVDKKHGEWFALLDRAGNPLPDYPDNKDCCKIGPWKCPYHNARSCIEVLKRVSSDAKG